jgi:hypothetical protein
MAADEIEHGQATVIADDGLTVDDARSDRQRLDRRCGEREPIGKVMAVARYQPNAAASAVRQDPEAIVLDLVNPARARRRLIGRSRQARIEGGKRLLGIQAAPKLTRNPARDNQWCAWSRVEALPVKDEAARIRPDPLYVFRLNRDPPTTAANIKPAAPSASMRIISMGIPIASCANSPSKSAVAAAAIKARTSSIGPHMQQQ